MSQKPCRLLLTPADIELIVSALDMQEHHITEVDHDGMSDEEIEESDWEMAEHHREHRKLIDYLKFFLPVVPAVENK